MKVTNWWAFIGGLSLVLAASVVAIPISFLVGLDQGSILSFWLFATLAPVVVLGSLAALLSLVSGDFSKGMLVGVSIAFLIAGTCNWVATEFGSKMPRIAG